MQLRVSDRADSEPIRAIAFGYLGAAAEDPELRSGAKITARLSLEVNEYRVSSAAVELPALQPHSIGVPSLWAYPASALQERKSISG